MKDRTIFMTTFDINRLKGLLSVAGEFKYRNRSDLSELASELCRAKIVDSKEIPPDVITMNSRVKLRDVDTNEEMEFTLVFPWDSNIDEGKISIIAPIGTAILGYSVGDTIKWHVPAGKRRIRIEKILYQPEAAGDYHL